jgi:DNA-binding NtrC family response regulator/pSer/pThr/pTyr-binding forkhead associated (FHA) protein
MLRLRIALRDQVRTESFERRELSIGSDPENDIVLDDAAVSRRHAIVRLDELSGEVWITDLGSRNGLLLDGRRLERHRLCIGEALQLGHAFLQIEDVPRDEIDLAITRQAPARIAEERHTSTGHLTPGLESEPRRVIELVRDLARADTLGRSEGARAFLERARELVWAETILIGSFDAMGQLAVRSVVGRPIGEEIQSEMLRLRLHAPPFRATAEGRILVVSEGRGRRLLAAVFARAGAANAWRMELLEQLAEWTFASSQTESDARSSRTGRSGPQPLRLPPDYVLGSSAAARELERTIELAARHPGTALILGEPGVGKEGVARAIHDSSPRAALPFLVVDATALRSELAASELFGIGNRVATGVDERKGLVAEAGDGTIFLDEIADLQPEVQGLLLRLLQTRDYRVTGRTKAESTRARFLAATNVDLEERVRQGRFRPDLLQRLSAVIVPVPPLRDRIEDLPEILDALLTKVLRKHSRDIRGISVGALRRLAELPWAGNIRQLEQELERAVLSTPEGAAIESRNFHVLRFAQPTPLHANANSLALVARSRAAPLLVKTTLPQKLQDLIESQRAEQIREALEATGGNKLAAARRLGIARTSLYKYLRKI